MTQLSDEVRAALTAGHPAHLATINPDGRPQVTLVWVGLDGDEIVSGHLGLHQKLRNVQRDPRVVLSLETGGHNAMGLDEYLVIQADARTTDGGAAELLQRLAAVYLGPDVKFPPLRRSAPRLHPPHDPHQDQRRRPLGHQVLTPALGHGPSSHRCSRFSWVSP